MTLFDPYGPMQGPRATRDVMKAMPARPAPAGDGPDVAATDNATQAVEAGQEDA